MTSPTDTAGLVKRLHEIADELDHPSDPDSDVLFLRQAADLIERLGAEVTQEEANAYATRSALRMSTKENLQKFLTRRLTT